MVKSLGADPSEEGEIDLVALIGLFVARKFTIVFISLLAVTAGVSFALVSAPVFQADGLVQLEEKSSGTALSAELAELFSETPQSVAEIEIINSRMVLSVVVDDLNLDWYAEPKRIPIIGGFLTRYAIPDPAWKLLKSYAWNEESISLRYLQVPQILIDEEIVLIARGSGQFTIDLDGRVISGLVGQILRDDLSGLSLFVDQLKGKTGREFVLQQRSLAQVLLELRSNLTISETGKNSSILRLTLAGSDPTQITEILDKILDVYLAQNLSRNTAEAQSSLGFIRQQIPEAQEQVRLAEEALNAYKSSQESVDLSFETRALLEQVVEIEAQLNALALEEQEVQKRYTPNHPVYQTLLENKQKLVERLDTIRVQTSSLPSTQQDMLGLTQDLEVAQTVYLQLFNRAQELNVIKAGTLGNVRIIDRSLAAPDPVAPNKALIVLLSLILGIIIALGFVILRSFMTRGIQSSAEIEQLGIPVYATVPKFRNGDYTVPGKRKGLLAILAQTEPTSLSVEALRSLRTSLHFGMMEGVTSLCAITSSRPGEGKSFLAVNLAVVAAQGGQKTCLVDVDLRRGYLRRFFGLSKSEPGLSEVLAGDVPIDDVVHHDSDTGLYFIPSGKYPPNPSELLMHARFKKVTEYLDSEFDIAFLDTPPVLAVTDPVIISKFVGMTLLVVRFGLTNISEVNAAQKNIENNGLKFGGAVLNAFDIKKSRQGKDGYDGSSYHYEYKARN